MKAPPHDNPRGCIRTKSPIFLKLHILSSSKLRRRTCMSHRESRLSFIVNLPPSISSDDESMLLNGVSYFATHHNLTPAAPETTIESYLLYGSGNGSFNPFPIWSKLASSVGGAQPAGDEVKVSCKDGNCFSVFRAIWKPNVNDLPQAEPGVNEGSNVEVTSKPEDSPQIGDVLSHLGGKTPGKHETKILKSVVYGGLMEVIASLSVIASVTAADATTRKFNALRYHFPISPGCVIGQFRVN
ncbi:hypothetical protein L1887_12474 [Cichorium endivia]|nr:hypothetical protein L1887_12474 [Cichorium endivia]